MATVYLCVQDAVSVEPLGEREDSHADLERVHVADGVGLVSR